jgi:hypothetical protein
VYLCWDWVEDGVVGFGGVWDEVVVVVVDVVEVLVFEDSSLLRAK